MKAILVIDMPKNCGLCPISDNWREKGEPKGFCPMDVNDHECDFVNRPSWCPLKPAPSEYVMSRGDSFDDCAWFYGYNKCVREVIGDDSD